MNITLNQIDFDRDDLKRIKGSVVSELIDGAEEDGSEFVLITFFNAERCEFIQLRVDNNGQLLISEPVNFNF